MSVKESDMVVAFESSSGRLCTYWDSYGSNRYLHIRYCYQDKKDGMWKPSAKGIAIPEPHAERVLQAMKQVLENSIDTAAVGGGI